MLQAFFSLTIILRNSWEEFASSCSICTGIPFLGCVGLLQFINVFVLLQDLIPLSEEDNEVVTKTFGEVEKISE